MVDKSIELIVRKYLRNLRQQGLPVAYGVVFGSQAQGNADLWSDIDLLVVSPQFDLGYRRMDINLLWRVAAQVDSRIEPVPAGEQEYLLDDSRAVLEIARREGQTIPLAA